MISNENARVCRYVQILALYSRFKESYCGAPEIQLAVSLGAEINIQSGIIVPWASFERYVPLKYLAVQFDGIVERLKRDLSSRIRKKLATAFLNLLKGWERNVFMTVDRSNHNNCQSRQLLRPTSPPISPLSSGRH